MDLVGLLTQFSGVLPHLLFTYWILAAGSVIVTILPVPTPEAFKQAVYLSACRGKLWHNKPNALGPFKDWSVPQSWFLHFYLTGAACNLLVLLAWACTQCKQEAPRDSNEVHSWLCLLFFQLHLLRRAAETALLMKYPVDSKMHGIAYLFGMSYYMAIPLSLLPTSWYLTHQWQQLIPASWGTQQQGGPPPGQPQVGQLLSCTWSSVSQISHDPWALLGGLVFLAGNWLQLQSHAHLARLSKGQSPSTEKAAYKVPKGGLFEYVSCPHYLSEIIIYCGLLALSKGRLIVALVLLWVSVNLVMAAAATHEWYKHHFKAYPPRRRALIPFIY